MKIKKCLVCQNYTLKDMCDGQKTVRATAPRFKPDDKYAHYRRLAKNVESNVSQKKQD